MEPVKNLKFVWGVFIKISKKRRYFYYSLMSLTEVVMTRSWLNTLTTNVPFIQKVAKDCNANHLTGFYMRETLTFNDVNRINSHLK